MKDMVIQTGNAGERSHELIHVVFIDRMSFSREGLRVEYRDYLLVCKSAEEDKDLDCLGEDEVVYSALKIPHFQLKETSDFWENRPVREFFEEYRDELRSMLGQLPSVRYGGTYILTNIRRKDMPFEKEVKQGGILQTSLVSIVPDIRVVILPRYINSLFEDEFNIHLKKGSLSDAVLVYGDRIEYLEFKTSTERHLSREVREGLSLSDDCFVIVDDIGNDSDAENGWNRLKCRLNGQDSGKKLYLAEIKGTGLVRLEGGVLSYYIAPEPFKKDVESLVDPETEKTVREQILQIRSYMANNNPQLANKLADYEDYLEAVKKNEIGDR